MKGNNHLFFFFFLEGLLWNNEEKVLIGMWGKIGDRESSDM